MRLIAIVLSLLALTKAGVAQDDTSDSIFVRAQPGTEAMLHMTRRVQESGRKVLMSVDLRVLSGMARVEFIDTESGEVLASSGTLSAENLQAEEHFEISAEKSLAMTTRAVQIRVVAMAGESEVMDVVLREVEAKIVEEDFGDLDALRRAAAELERGLAEGPKVGAHDHESTCTDPSHNHHGHSHDHSSHSHGQSGQSQVIADPAAAPQTEWKDDASSELRKLRNRVRELEKTNGKLKERVTELESRLRSRDQGQRSESGMEEVRLCALMDDPVSVAVSLPADSWTRGDRLATTALATQRTGPRDARLTSASFEAVPIRVVVSLPILADLVRRIGGDRVTITTLCTPGSDPHEVRMTPALIASIENAHMLVESGMGLESWVERAIAASGNDQIGRGKFGHVFATNGVTPLEIPTTTDLAAGGHVHAAGNPHAWLSPLNLKVMAANIEAGLARINALNSSHFAERRARFEREIDDRLFGPELVKLLGSRYLDRLHRAGELIPFLEKKKLKGRPLIESLGGWLARARELETRKLITYHKTWSYLVRSLDLEVVATIEEKPGIPPAPAHLASLAKLARERKVKLVVAPPYYPRNRIDALAEQIGGYSVVLPTQPGESEGAKDALTLFDDILVRLAGRT